MLYTHPGREDARPEVTAREAWGYLYVMSVAGSRALKVGMTYRTPSARAADMHHTIGPSRLHVEMAWRCSDAARLERGVHRALVAGGARRVGGEWFDASLPTIEHEVERVAEVYRINVEQAALSDD